MPAAESGSHVDGRCAMLVRVPAYRGGLLALTATIDTEGIAFSRGLAEPDAPTIAVRDLTGAVVRHPLPPSRYAP